MWHIQPLSMVFLINHCINDNQSLLRVHNGCSVLICILSRYAAMNDQHCSTIRSSCSCWWQHAPGGEPKGSRSVSRAYEATMIVVVETLANFWLQLMADKRLLLVVRCLPWGYSTKLIAMNSVSWKCLMFHGFSIATWDYHRAYLRKLLQWERSAQGNPSLYPWFDLWLDLRLEPWLDLWLFDIQYINTHVLTNK